MANQDKCYGCGTSEDLELTKYSDTKKKSWYDSDNMAVVTEKTTYRSERLLCKNCINKAIKFSKTVILIGITVILSGVGLLILLEIFHTPSFYSSFFLSKESQFDYLDLLPLAIFGVGIYIIYYGNRIKTQPSRHF